MIRLEIVKGCGGSGDLPFEDQFGASTAATLRLVEPWLRTDRVVCGDSWFASVGTASALMRYNMIFIGVVKNVTREYPMDFLSKKELANRGDHISLVSKEDGDSRELMALLSSGGIFSVHAP